eukprot:scaffold22970_cov27-Phaeocystis_antarctica.AAC.1
MLRVCRHRASLRGEAAARRQAAAGARRARSGQPRAVAARPRAAWRGRAGAARSMWAGGAVAVARA